MWPVLLEFLLHITSGGISGMAAKRGRRESVLFRRDFLCSVPYTCGLEREEVPWLLAQAGNIPLLFRLLLYPLCPISQSGAVSETGICHWWSPAGTYNCMESSALAVYSFFTIVLIVYLKTLFIGISRTRRIRRSKRILVQNGTSYWSWTL